jgi:signal transduction histidine kinase
VSRWRDRFDWPVRRFAWIDVAWGVFALLNAAAIVWFGTWETVPFHFIWVSLTILYGFRVWAIRPTALVLAGIMAITGGLILLDVIRGNQPPDELTEVPLMAAMFVAMVWHARRRLAATSEIERVSEANLRLLQRQRRFVQDASHELRTPIAVAIGHAELIARAGDPRTSDDARVVIEELGRLRRIADRLLLLAAAEDPQFLHRIPVEVEPVVVDTLRRWSPVPRVWRLGRLDEIVIDADADRLRVAIDALVENAVKHTRPSDPIELSAFRSDGSAVIRVSDGGTGIAGSDLERIFERFARADDGRSRDPNGDYGTGLGLAIVKTVVEAHGGQVRVRSAPGRGSDFDLVLPGASPEDGQGLAAADAEGVGVGTTEGAAPTLAGPAKPNQ